MHFHNRSKVVCRTLILLAFLLLALASPVLSAVSVEVKVSGVEPKLHDNILARLTLYLQRQSERLQSGMVRRLHNKAPEDIRSALAPYGYYHPKIKSSLVRKDKGWVAEYQVEKGEPVKVESISVQIVGEGQTHARLNEAKAKFPLKAGDILNQDLYEKGKRRLARVAYSEGFLDAVFSVRSLRIDRDANKASIELVLDTKKLYRFGEASTDSNVIEKELLEKYFPFQPGDPYNPAKLFELQSILYRTDYFSQVEVRGLPDLAEDLEIPVKIDLAAPEKLNKYSFGLGYGTDTGARGKVDWANRLFNSRGHKISGSLQVAELESLISLRYEIPRHFDPRYDKVIHNIAYQDKTWEDTNTRLFTAAVSREYSGPRFKFGGGIEIRDEVYDIGDTSGDSTLLLPSLNGGFTIADDILKTKNGIQASVGLLGAVEGFISDASFLQGTLNGKVIFTPIEKWRLIGRGSLGATLVESIDLLPPSLRFYTGGDTTIRGYGYKSIGTTDSSGAVIGGRYLVVGSIELERSINDQWSVAAFWDGGTATDDLSVNFSQGAGGGVRFHLPFGQIRLDVASAITENGNPIRFHLTVGGDF